MIKSVKKYPQRNCLNVYGNLQCFHFTILKLSLEGNLLSGFRFILFVFPSPGILATPLIHRMG
jgi:hypothetical protein